MFVLGYFFFLRDGDELMRYIKRILPLQSSHKEALLLRFRDVTLAVFVDNLFVAFLQGSLVGLGFWIFGLQAPIFWGVIAMFFALIPFIGTSVVWLPAALYLALTGKWITAVLLTLYGMIVVGLSDNVTRPLLLKGKIQVHPFLILLSILGGIEVFGVFMGLFIGPMIVSFLISVIQLYQLDYYKS
jgi:predicted PurR-regulated permease PerM